jgi:Zn-dependent peptidase ImmA (M78 family)
MVIESPPNVTKDRISKPVGYLRTEMEPAHDAWDLVKRMWLKEPSRITLPVDVFEISNRMGIKTWADDTLPPDVSGILRKATDFGSPEIFLNDIDPLELRLFTCAHALGHYVWNVEIGRGGVWEIVVGRDFFATELHEVEEIYATEFAAEMLMPRAALVEIGGNPTVAALAAKFAVTGEIMKFRLDQIGWRG